MSHQACPICQGCGTVPQGFYTRLGLSTTTGHEQCRRCGGLGTISSTALSEEEREELLDVRRQRVAEIKELRSI